MFKVKIKIWNAAFDDEGKAMELSRMLKEVASKIERGFYQGKIKDINGNTVGEYSIK